MQPPLLLFDIGNTTTKVGLVRDGRMQQYTLPTDTAQTVDGLGLMLSVLMLDAGCAFRSVGAAVVSSVVPGMDPLLRAAIARYAGCPLYFVPHDLPVPLENRYRQPGEVGADRLVAAYAARSRYPAANSLVVVDFGTAATFDCVTENAYLGGLIFPGPQTALNALAGATAKLPKINLDSEDAVPDPGRDTVTSIRHGILFGFAAMTEGLIRQLSARLEGPVKVIGTGGFALTMAKFCTLFDEIRSGLLLEGLEQLFRTHKS